MKVIYFLLIGIFFISCNETNHMYRRFNKYKTPIFYIHDSKISDCPKKDTLVVTLNKFELDSFTTVKKTKKIFLPLLLFTFRKTDFNVKLGQSGLYQEYEKFLINSLKEESNRTGCFKISNDFMNDSFYKLNISIDSCQTFALYRRSFSMFLFFGLSRREKAAPSETNLQVTIRLTKGNNEIFKKSYKIVKDQPYIVDNAESIGDLRELFIDNMVESLSLSTKECIDKIIKDINIFLKKK